jgi:uncharacterized phage-associated protein
MAYNKSQIDRIGNLLVYITSKLGAIPKTKLLKLIYIIEEESIKKGGTQFTDLSYTYLPMGPVSTFVNTQIVKKREPLCNFINVEMKGKAAIISPKSSFNDDEFSDFDIQLMDEVLHKFGSWKAKDLIDYTHREGSPWKKIDNDYQQNPPADKRTLDMSILLNQKGVDSRLKNIAEEENAFIHYLKN